MENIKILVTGSRDWEDVKKIKEVLEKLNTEYKNVTLIHGGAKGVDTFSEHIAKNLGWKIIKVLPDWSLGRKAGPLRNQKMIDDYSPDLGIAFNKNNSAGTTDCTNRMRKAGIKILEFTSN